MNPYVEIMEHFGYRAQMKKLHEECFEFLEAVDNYEDMLLLSKRNSELEEDIARSFVVEEMGDILLLLTQFIAKYEIKQEELDHFMDEKLSRTLSRIEEGYYKEENQENVLTKDE